MSLTDTGAHRNRQWTRQLLEREIAYCESEARVLEQHALRCLEKAHILEREAVRLQDELEALAAEEGLPMLLARQAG